MKETVSVSAPGKLMLFGEHAVLSGKPCIVTAVDQRLTSQVSIIEEKSLEIDSPAVGIKHYAKKNDELGNGDIPKGVRFIEFAVKNFRDVYPFESGVKVSTKSEFNHTFGFGSSSAVTVCVIKGLSESFEKHLSEREIFDLSYKTILDVQGKGSGFDVASAVYGRTIFFQNAGKVIEPLKLPNEFNLIVGYSGVKADTVEMINKVKALEDMDKKLVDSVYDRIGEIVYEVKKESDLEKIGQLMNENQHLLQRLDVSTEKLDAMIHSAVSSGAYGAKLSGAGGGDCMIALCPKEKIDVIKRSIEKEGGEILDTKVNARGVKVL